MVTIKGQEDEKRIPSGTWTTSYHHHDDSRINDSVNMSKPYERNSLHNSNYDMNSRKCSDFDRNKNESSERKSSSHSYPYPYPSPYNDARNSSIDAYSSSPTLEYDSKHHPNYPQETESDVLSQRNGYTYQSPFRDFTISSREGK